MGLVGYVDRNRKNNDELNDSLEMSLGWSFYKREKLKEVTKPNKKETEIIGVYSHKVIVPNDVLVFYEKEIENLIHYMKQIDIEELQAYCWSNKKKNYEWEEYLQSQCQKIWQLLKQALKMAEVIVYEEDLESLVRFFVNGSASNKLKNKMIFDYFLCRISAMLELNCEEQEFIKTYEKNGKVIISFYKKKEILIRKWEKNFQHYKFLNL